MTNSLESYRIYVSPEGDKEIQMVDFKIFTHNSIPTWKTVQVLPWGVELICTTNPNEYDWDSPFLPEGLSLIHSQYNRFKALFPKEEIIAHHS